MSRIHKTTLTAAMSMSMAMMAGQTQAAGFALMEQNATDLGQAYANLASGNGRSNAIFGNPASMALIDGTAASAGASYIRPSFKLQETRPTGLTGGLGGDAGETAYIPNASFVHRLDERTRLGFALSVPFGLATDYDEDWLGRYYGVESHVEVIDLNPVMSYDLTPELTIAGGINIQYAEAKLSSVAGPPLPEGLTTVEGDDWSIGLNLGVLWRPTDRTRLGLSYRSGVDHGLDGDIEYTATPALNGDVRAGLDLPPTVAASVTHRFADTLQASLGLLWTGWSSFDELRVRQVETGADDIVTPENWDDTLRVSAGGEWQFAPRWTMRAGTAYDPTPVPSADFRTVRLPGGDRIWASTGLGYEINSHWSLDVGYTHIWMNDMSIDEGDSPANVTGRYEGEIDILGLQVNARF